jgi:hypothetical protein
MNYGQEKFEYPALLILQNKYLWSKDFLAERVHLNRATVPFDSDSASQSLTQPHFPSLYTPS